MQFIQMEYSRVGADSHITPREIIRDFIELLDILYQHPEKTAGELLKSQAFGNMPTGTVGSSFVKPENTDREDADELATFTL